MPRCQPKKDIISWPGNWDSPSLELSILDDSFLVKRSMNGDKLAFTEMFIRYWDYVFVVANKILFSEEDAEELAQNSFFQCAKHPFDETRCPRFATYLWKLVKWGRRKRIREKDFPPDVLCSLDWTNTRGGEPLANLVPDESQSPEDDLYADELQRGIWEASLRLKRESGAVFYLSFYERLKAPEIAKKLGKSISNVTSHLYNARRRIKHLMCKEGYF